MDGLLGFLLTGIALAGTPGPATLSLAATGAAFGARRGLGYMAGIVAGMIGVMAVTATGVTGMVLAVPGAMPAVSTAAILYFLYLAWQIATAPPLAERPDPRARPTFLAGILLSLVNPKGYAAMAAVFSGFVLADQRPVLDAILKIAVMLAIVVAVDVAWLLAGAELTRHFRAPRSNRAINVIFAILLLASVLATVW